jgi:hypothetical protein
MGLIRVFAFDGSPRGQVEGIPMQTNLDSNNPIFTLDVCCVVLLLLLGLVTCHCSGAFLHLARCGTPLPQLPRHSCNVDE